MAITATPVPAGALDERAHTAPLDAARALAACLESGCRFHPLVLEGLPLLAGEHAYAEVDAVGWRWPTTTTAASTGRSTASPSPGPDASTSRRART